MTADEKLNLFVGGAKKRSGRSLQDLALIKVEDGIKKVARL